MEYNLATLRDQLNDDKWDLPFYDIVRDVLDRSENPNEDEDIFYSIDTALMYYDDQWIVLKHYCVPTEANWEYAIEEFTNLIFHLSSILDKEQAWEKENCT